MFLVNLVVEPDLCNLRCSYCWLTASEEYVVRTGNLLVPRGRASQPARTVAEVATRVDALLAQVEATVLKVSGGEVGLLPEILDVVERRSSQFTKVQILTNGTSFDRIARRRLPQSKYCFQVSLDAHLPAGNVDRFGRVAERRTREVLGVLGTLSAAEYQVEINCVLTPRNLDQIVGFADYVRDSLPGATLFPFPARFTAPCFALGAGPDALDVLIERHVEWAGALPPPNLSRGAAHRGPAWQARAMPPAGRDHEPLGRWRRRPLSLW
jgi:sulfatase maturation enzyme AslB (radical SAM superfamily)